MNARCVLGIFLLNIACVSIAMQHMPYKKPKVVRQERLQLRSAAELTALFTEHELLEFAKITFLLDLCADQQLYPVRVVNMVDCALNMYERHFKRRIPAAFAERKAQAMYERRAQIFELLMSGVNGGLRQLQDIGEYVAPEKSDPSSRRENATAQD